VDRGWSEIPQSELSGEEWTDCLASIRPVSITEPDYVRWRTDGHRHASSLIESLLDSRSSRNGRLLDCRPTSATSRVTTRVLAVIDSLLRTSLRSPP